MRGRGFRVLRGVLPGVILPGVIFWGGSVAVPGCAGSVPGGTPGQTDGGRGTHGPRVDTDGDGLCDDTEARERTDPRNADTDGDGLVDSLEVLLGTDPLTASDPPPGDRLTLSEAPGAVAPLEQFVDFQGTRGEVVRGAIQDRGPGTDGRAALGYAAFDVEAVDADPAAFVGGTAGPRFVGVLGETRLHWRVTVRSADGSVPLGCRRGYGFTFLVERSGGEVVFSHRMVLDVVPAQGGTDAGLPDGGTAVAVVPWGRVSPAGLCLPDPPCQ